MSKKRPIIIDTDPGIDDAIALAIALNAKALDVKLITTVVGNVSLEKVTNNLLKLLNFWDKNIPVAIGADRPLLEPMVDASNVHGTTGMDGYDFPAPRTDLLLNIHAIDAMYDVLKSSTEKITLVPIGPLTNIALLLRKHPDAEKYIEEIVLMGGSAGRGNKGVMSEFNIATDPEAAAIVFESGIPIVMAGLDVGWKALVYPEDSIKIKDFGKNGDMVYKLLQKYRGGSLKTGLKMYDSCAIAYLLKPEIFTVVETYVGIELTGTYTRGTTVVDLKGYLKRPANAKVCMEIDEKMFKDWLLDALAKCD